MKKYVFPVFVFSLLATQTLFLNQTFAQTSDQAMQKQIDELTNRVKELESQNAQQSQQQTTPAADMNDPFQEMNRLRNEMNSMFQNSFGRTGSSSSGALNGNMSYSDDLSVQEEGDHYLIKVDTAGLDKDKIDIEVQGRTLTVSGQSSRQDEKKDPNHSFQMKGFQAFARTISLPEDADISKMETKKEGDALVITFLKKNSR